jgi:hypothetical protein
MAPDAVPTPRTFTTADLPASFRPDPVDVAIRAAARRAGLRVSDCPHGRDDCDDCLSRAALLLLDEVRPRVA